MEPLADTVIAGRYALEYELGKGGMGTVWSALDRKLERPVAVKLLLVDRLTHANATRRFEREAKAVAQLRSPHIVEVHDYGIDGGRPFMVMERLDGCDLSRRMRELGRMPLDIAARVVHQVAKALACAHAAGIVHRDLKPNNIFLATVGEEELVKVFDFGIAKALRSDGPHSEMTEEGMMLGTPRYMSPEQVHGAKRVDHRSDLWSLAVIVYRAITGHVPFDGTGHGELLTQICVGSFAPPSEHWPDLPPGIDGFFARALAKEADARFADAREFSIAFSQAAGIDVSDSMSFEKQQPASATDSETLVTVASAGVPSSALDTVPVESATVPDSVRIAPALTAGVPSDTLPDRPSEPGTLESATKAPAPTPKRDPWRAFALAALVVAIGGWVFVGFRADTAPATQPVSPAASPTPATVLDSSTTATANPSASVPSAQPSAKDAHSGPREIVPSPQPRPILTAAPSAPEIGNARPAARPEDDMWDGLD